MEIFTVVKANIKSHFGQFIGVILMMMIAVTSILSFSNVLFSVSASIKEANEVAHTADQSLMISRSDFTSELKEILVNKDEISSVNEIGVLGLHSIKLPGDEDNIHSYDSQTFLMPDTGRYPLIREDFSGLSKEAVNAKPGEIYFASGISEQMGIKPGDKVIIQCESTMRELTFAGYIEEPWGGTTIGWKHCVVNIEDFEDFYNEVCETYAEFDIASEYDLYIVEINMKDSNLSVDEMNRIINENTGIFDMAQGSLSKKESTQYMGLLLQIVSSILIGVAVILYIVLMVVITNNISTTVKTDYKTLGVYKSQGFSSSKLRAVYLWQYLIAEIIGIVMGFILSFILLKVLLNKFSPIVGVVLTPNYSVILVTASLVLIVGISILVINLCTTKISRVSPHKAISEGQDDISFKSRVICPISKTLLSASVAIRNITSSFSQYLGIMITSLILVVLMVFTVVGGQCLESKNTMLSVTSICELGVPHYDDLTSEEKAEIRDIVSSYATITSEFTKTSCYISCENTKVQCSIFENPSEITWIIDGRAPLYDNEVVIGTGIAARLGKTIGDEVTLTYNDISYDYLITGICNTLSDVGLVVDIGLPAATHIGLDERACYFYHGFVLENPVNKNEWYPREDAEIIAEAINEHFEQVDAIATDTNFFGSIFGDVVSFAGYIVYALTAIFVIIIVTMACTKCFNNERRQLGIYKAMGFTSSRLRLQFAFRFMIVFAIGAFIGLIAAGFMVKPFFILIFSTMGAGKMTIDFVPSSYVEPLMVICFSSFVFAYLASNKVKKIDVNELIVE